MHSIWPEMRDNWQVPQQHPPISASAMADRSAPVPGRTPSSTFKPILIPESTMTTMTFTKTAPPDWLLAFWKEIDDKTFGKGFDCFAEDATCRLGVAEWNGREKIRDSLRAFIDTGFTAHHDVTEFWDGGSIKIFRGIVTMQPDDASKPAGKPGRTHICYLDE